MEYEAGGLHHSCLAQRFRSAVASTTPEFIWTFVLLDLSSRLPLSNYAVNCESD